MPLFTAGRARASLAVLGVGCLALWIGARGYDDGFITYVYARSLAGGAGLTWEGLPVLATTSPLLAVGLAAAELALPLGVPVWGAVVGWISIAVAVAGLVALGRCEDWGGGGAVAGAALAASPLLHDYVGGEYLPATACVVLAALLWSRRRGLAAGILLGLAVALRPEVGLAAVPMALAARSGPERSDLRSVARVAITAIATLAIWLLTLATLTGTIVPTSLAAKRAQGESALGLWPSGWELAATLARDLPAGMARDAGLVGVLMMLALAGTGLVAWAKPGWRQRPFTSALVVWGPLHGLLLAALGVGAYAWYSTPLVVTFAILIGWSWELPRGWPRASRRGFRLVAVALLVAFHVVGSGAPRRPFRRLADPKRSAYERVARLADAYPDGTRIATYEIGYLAWEARNPVVDLLGLVSPEVPLDAVRAGDLAAVRERLDPDLLMLPLDGGSLVRATIGDPHRFLSSFRLDKLQLDGRPPIAVYRRATLPGRGPVFRDLAPELAADAGSGVAVRYAEHRNGSALAVVLPPGAHPAFELPDAGELRFASGFSAAAGSAAALDSVADAGRVRIATIRSDGEPRWIGWSAALECAAPPCRIEISCLGRGADPCLLAFPHLEAPAGEERARR